RRPGAATPVEAAEQGADRQHAETAGDDADQHHRGPPREPSAGPSLRDQLQDRIARRVRLMAGDVVVADAEREVHRVEVFERGRNIWKGKGKEKKRENGDARLKGSRSNQPIPRCTHRVVRSTRPLCRSATLKPSRRASLSG